MILHWILYGHLKRLDYTYIDNEQVDFCTTCGRGKVAA